MSTTRRSTRASSRLSGASAVLPKATRPSTSYGTNATAPPAAIRPSIGLSLENAIRNVRQSSDEPSFSVEAAIANDAELESSILSPPTRSATRPAARFTTRPAPPPPAPRVQLASQVPVLAPIIRNHRVERVQDFNTEPDASHAQQHAQSHAQWTLMIWTWIRSLGTAFWSFLIGFLIITALYHAMCVEPPSAYEEGLAHRIGQFIPGLSTQTEYSQDDDPYHLRKRMHVAEKNILSLQNQQKMDHSTIDKLDNMLPNMVAVKKDKKGSYSIPDDLWHGLREKIRNDNTLLQNKIDSMYGITEGDVRQIAASEAKSIYQEPAAKKLWDEWLDSNEEKIAEWLRKPQRYGDDVEVLGKDAILAMMEENFKDTLDAQRGAQRDIEKKVAEVTKKLETSLQQITRLEREQIPRNQLEFMVEHFVKDMTSGLQLDRQSSANIHNSAQRGLRLVNHLSLGTGAVIIPTLTSPAYTDPKNDNFLAKWFGKAPDPNPPVTALTAWDEYGECWCSAQDGGFGPSLAVALGNSVYPRSVLVEHIGAEATLAPGATPRHMELLGYVEEGVEGLMPEASVGLGWYRLAQWTYDIEGDMVQSFPVSVTARTNKVVIRARTNWGGADTPYTCLYRVRMTGDLD